MHELFETMGTGIIALLIVFFGVIEFLWAKEYLSADKEGREIMKKHAEKREFRHMSRRVHNRYDFNFVYASFLLK